MRSPDSTTQQQSPEVTSLEASKSTRSSEINLAEGSVLPRLRKEIESLKKKFLQVKSLFTISFFNRHRENVPLFNGLLFCKFIFSSLLSSFLPETLSDVFSKLIPI